MLAAFTSRPDFTAYTAQQPSQNLREVNPVTAQSAAQDLSAADRINMTVFNQAIWAGIKGAGLPMPAPQHSLFPPLMTSPPPPCRATPTGTDIGVRALG